MTMARTIRKYLLPVAPLTPGLRPMEPRDVPVACALLNEYLTRCGHASWPAPHVSYSHLAAALPPSPLPLRRFKFAPHYSEEEFAHALLPRPGVVDSFVVDDPASVPRGLSGLISFYHLPSTVIGARGGGGPLEPARVPSLPPSPPAGNPLHKSMHAVYSYYNVPGRHGMAAMLGDALILAKARGADVFNCLDLQVRGRGRAGPRRGQRATDARSPRLQENESVLSDLKFGPGDGSLQYYLYNWQCPAVRSEDVGLVLL